MPGDLVINSITIEGLRGFNNAQTIKLDGSHGLISGPIGTGKTSTLYAIEWVLFDDIAHLKCPESKTQAEFVNANKIDQKARVTLKLKGPDGDYIITRQKNAKKRASSLTITTPKGEFKDTNAEKQIFSIFGTIEDFHRSVFLHQEAIRAILTEKPEERDSALDRLFGLERTRELMKAIPLIKVRNEYEDLNEKKNRIEEGIRGAIRQAEVELLGAQKGASEFGLKKEDLNFQRCIQGFEEIILKTSNAARDCGIDDPLFSKPSSGGMVSKELKKVKEILQRCRSQIYTTSRYSEVQQYSRLISTSKEELVQSLGESERAFKEYKETEKNLGTIEQNETKENLLKQRDEYLKNDRKTLDSTSKLVADGIEVLSQQELKNCPICDGSISSKDVLLKLQTKVNTTLKNQLSEIDRQRDEIREELLQHTNNKRAILGLIKIFDDAKKIKNFKIVALGKILQSQSKEEKNLLQEADEKLSELQKEMDRLGQDLNKKNETLQKIEASVDICMAIVNVLGKEEEYVKINKTFSEEKSQIQILNNQITELSVLHTRLQRISDAITTAQINLAREFIGKGDKKISDYYGKLCNHPYYNSVRIDIEPRNVKGVQKNTYNIKAFNNKEGKETLISTRFSTGQMNCAALSIFLSLSSILDRKTNFLILDDPSQNLDSEHKKSLVSVLNDVCQGGQVIIATQDAELEQKISDGFNPKGGYTSLAYERWDKEGPTIRISKRGI